MNLYFSPLRMCDAYLADLRLLLMQRRCILFCCCLKGMFFVLLCITI